MLKRYYNSSDERLLKEKSTVTFEEIAGDIFYVEKDRLGAYGDYVNSNDVINALNNRNIKVFVKGSRGYFSNFELNL